ncbi:calcium-binding protein [Paracoccus pacificus]|uniref:Calcium-binding protein n=2 Tax=Paracoccus pacificus TaxID=1463598 RepID=A0ABW4RCE8_9RHOB
MGNEWWLLGLLPLAALAAAIMNGGSDDGSDDDDDGNFPDELDLPPPPADPEDPTIVGTDGADNLTGTPDADFIAGAGGNDTISDGVADSDPTTIDKFYGAGGDDLIDSLEGPTYVVGGDGDDTVNGGAANDTILGGPGDDVIDVGGLPSEGETGADWAHGSRGDDTITGGAGDTLYGGGGEDHISGGEFQHGGVGDDTLVATAGINDVTYMKGGADDDLFQINLNKGESAEILDFKSGTDKLEVSVRDQDDLTEDGYVRMTMVEDADGNTVVLIGNPDDPIARLNDLDKLKESDFPQGFRTAEELAAEQKT